VCAAALASIDFMIENDLCKQSIEKGSYFVEKLKEHELSKVRDIRNLGLMIGIELKEKVQPLLLELMQNKVIGLPAGTTVLRLLPPLVISYEDLDTVADKLVELLK
jgi:acetylornithine/LysW-gamma-L-lysine aminotransferase